MSNLQSFFSAEFTYALGWTILHSFWQCVLVALLLAVILRGTKKLSSNTRYLFACSALVLCFVISVETFISYWQLARQARIEQTLELLGVTLPRALNAQSHIQQWLALADEYLLWIVYSWLLGCALVSLRNLVDYLRCVNLQRAHDQAVDEHWQATVNRLARSIDLPRQVFMRISYLVDVPSTLGYFKPIILIPAGLLTHLSQAQLEVILLHELGHIRRNDYAIGLIQVALKTLFFFNPMALWISTIIDEERENACDDIAVEQCKDALFFSKTLKEFADMNVQKNLSMAISKNKMHLLSRIKRQFTQRKRVSRAIEKLMASIALVSCCAAATVYAQTNSPAQAEIFNKQLTETILQSPALTQLPANERLAAAKEYLNLADTRQEKAAEKSGDLPSGTPAQVNSEKIAAAKDFSAVKQQAANPTPVSETLAQAAPKPALVAASTAPKVESASLEQEITVITVFGRPTREISRISHVPAPESASHCGFISSAHCSSQEANFVSARNYILRKDKTLDEGLAAYNMGNFELALERFKKSYSKIGYDEAALYLGNMYLYGQGTKADIKEAIKWYRELAETRFSFRQEIQFSPANPEKASLRVQAQIKLARIYASGLAGQKDPKLARKWYQAASDLKYVPAHYILGQMYQSGNGGNKNLKKAVKLYTLAAESGHAGAQFALAEYYHAAEDTDANRKLSFEWYQQAAFNPYPNAKKPHAQLALAEMYDQGIGVTADPKKAFAFYKLSAKAGHPDAQNALAIYFYSGEVVEKDLALARRLFSVAAEQDQSDAMFNLAIMQSKGEGGEIDVVKAYALLKQAEKLGHKKASAAAARLELKLMPEQKVQAESWLSST